MQLAGDDEANDLGEVLSSIWHSARSSPVWRFYNWLRAIRGNNPTCAGQRTAGHWKPENVVPTHFPPPPLDLPIGLLKRM
eukprot:4614368-Karenia_brevis.AAC.1